MQIGAKYPFRKSHSRAYLLSAMASDVNCNAPPSTSRLFRIANISCPRLLYARVAIPIETKSGGKEKPKQHKTKRGSQVIGVKHGQPVGEIVDGIKKDIKPNEKVTFVAEGGWIENGKVKGLTGEQKKIAQGLVNYFGKNLEITTMEENADVSDNESPVFKYIQEKVNPTRMRSIELYFRHNKTAISKDKV